MGRADGRGLTLVNPHRSVAGKDSHDRGRANQAAVLFVDLHPPRGGDLNQLGGVILPEVLLLLFLLKGPAVDGIVDRLPQVGQGRVQTDLLPLNGGDVAPLGRAFQILGLFDQCGGGGYGSVRRLFRGVEGLLETVHCYSQRRCYGSLMLQQS